MKLVVAYGAGDNSTAMLVEFVRRAIVPDAILFADTGGELPKTYAYVQMFSMWLQRRDFPAIVTVHNDGQYATLERNCLETGTLPSLAYGGRSCSEKYKHRPQNKWVKQAWGNARVRKAIGIHTGEAHRAGIASDAHYDYWYPLVEWDWDGERCCDEIRKAELEPPGKSACYYCPAAKKHEVLQLSQCEPSLFARAVAIEDAAKAAGNLQTVKGLGRHWSWRALVKTDREQMALMPEATELPCMCGQ